MIRLLYNLLFPLGFLVFLPGYLLKMRRRGGYQRHFGQRFGFYDVAVRKRLEAGARTWIYAVSVGEVAIALKLAAKLRELDSGFACVLTTTTTTGFAFAEKEAPAWMEVLYNPLDFWPIMQHAFAVIRPVRILLVEAEVWPNLAAGAQARGIPLALVNARLSARSERRFLSWRRFVAPTFRCLDLVCVPEPGDAERWAAFGISRDLIHEVGSIKYDSMETGTDTVLPRRILGSFCIDGARPILLAGSTHAGEEEILARAFLQLRAEFPTLVLMIAPRHVERTAEIGRHLQQLRLQVALRSARDSGHRAEPDCLLLDTTGELRDWYAVATVVFIGKSLTAHGGQNPVEPILAGKPVIFGPHMENFAVLARSLLEHDAALQVQDAAELIDRCAELLRDPARRSELVQNAERVLARHRGATARTAELVLSLRSRAGHASSPK
ncbi:MAG TPA: glycosyltransferase N-terminal domain-containing protein [Chthoniobacterales bacterium]|nr:glycosyltransferase N-terminal domain-containing protein [Chthoniobacterales bacterium]